MLAALLAAHLFPLVLGGLTQDLWPSTAFAPQSAAVTSQIASLNFTGGTAVFPPLCSVRFTGTLVDAAATELLSFSILSDGGVRLWIDEWLVVDAGGNRSAAPGGGGAQNHTGFLSVPFSRGSPRSLRLEYTRWAIPGAAATLQLFWWGNTTAAAVVPAAALLPGVSPFLARRAALRDRLECPRVPWQTYSMQTMTAHVLMPAGFAVSATLAVAGGGRQTPRWAAWCPSARATPRWCSRACAASTAPTTRCSPCPTGRPRGTPR